MRAPNIPSRIRALFAVFVLTAAPVFVAHATEEDKGLLASFISRVLSSPDMQISIGAVDGALYSNSTIRDVTIADRDGVWLRLDSAKLVWSRLALLRGRLDVDSLEIGHLTVLRRAHAQPTDTKPPPFTSLLPDIPVAVDVKKFTLQDAELGAPIIGQPAKFSAQGHAKLGDAAAGLDLDLEVKRLDAEGTIVIRLGYEAKSGALDVAFQVNEPAGGIIAGLANLPGKPPFVLDLHGDGTLDNFPATLSLSAGPEISAQGLATLMRDGDARDFTVQGDGRFSTFLPERLAPLLAGDSKMTARGKITNGSVWNFDTLDLTGASATIHYAGAVGADKVAGQAKIEIPSIELFGRAFDRPLAGRASVTADVDANPTARTFALKLDGAIDHPHTGIAAVDGLVGDRLTLNGPVAVANTTIQTTALNLAGEHVTVRLANDGVGATGTTRLTIDLPELARLDSRVTGHAAGSVSLIGDLAKPDAAATIIVENASAIGRPIHRLSLDAKTRDLFGAAATAMTLDGDVDGKPARGSLTFAKLDDGGWRLDPSEVSFGRADLRGDGSIAASGLATGHVTLAAPSLDDVSALALQKLDGSLNLDATLSADAGKQNADVTANGARIRAAGLSVDRLSLAGKFGDVLGKLSANATAAIENANVAGQAIPRMKLAASGDAAATSWTLAGEARGFQIDARAVTRIGDKIQIDIASLNARRAGHGISLAAPATLYVQGGDVSMDRLSIAAESGRLTISGKAGKTLDLSIDAKALPLSLASLAAPSVNLSGTLDASAKLRGAAAAPEGEWQARISKLSEAKARAAGAPPLDINASGRLDGHRTSVDARVNAGAFGALTVTGSVPIDGSPGLDIAARGTVDAAAANNALAVNGQILKGKINIDLRATGALDAPQLSGSATMAGGSFSDPLNGIKLDAITARLVGSGHEITIEQLTAKTANGGTLSGVGKIILAAEAGYPISLRITGRNAKLNATDIVSSVADLDIDISGALNHKPTVAGKVTFVSMDVTIPERLPLTLLPLPNARHIDPRPFAAEIIALERKARAAKKKQTPFDASLNLTISAPNKIFVRGRGIDAEFGGDLRLTGTVRAPIANGQFTLRRGSLTFASKRLDFSQGKLTFAGGLTPEINFVAQTTTTDATLEVTVSGEASSPTFAFQSQPTLPPDEVMSQLLFSKSSGSLSAFQAVMLAQTVAQFTDAGAGLNVFDKLRKSLGVDSLDIQDGTNGPTVGASRYINDRISLGVKTGATPADTSVGVKVDITKQLRGLGQVGADGSTAVGLGVEWEY